jgi:hypothetical protein
MKKKIIWVLVAILVIAVASILFVSKTEPEKTTIRHEMDFETKKAALETMGTLLGLRMLCLESKEKNPQEILQLELGRVSNWIILETKDRKTNPDEAPKLQGAFNAGVFGVQLGRFKNVLTEALIVKGQEGDWIEAENKFEMQEKQILKNCAKYDVEYDRIILDGERPAE